MTQIHVSVTASQGELAAAFTEWDRRFREEPERFTSEAVRLLQQTPETYGEACAPYFVYLLSELNGEQASAAESMTTKAPAIGQPWPGQGGIYAGLARGEDGQPDHHLVLAVEQPAIRLKWAAGVEWARGIEADGHKDFALPTRFESALLYANLRDQFDTSAWYWTSTQYSDGCAWDQDFGNGYQDVNDKSYEGRVRAVRRLTA